MTRLKIFLFGAPRVERDGSVIKISRRKAMALLAYLAGSGGLQQRDHLATLLWPVRSQAEARNALSRHLSSLKRALGSGWLLLERETVGVDPAAVWLDVAQFRQLLAEGQSHDHAPGEVCPACLEPLSQAAALYRDDVMAGFTLPDCPDFDEWQFFQGEGLRQALAGALERLVRVYQARGDPVAAIPLARRRLALDPLHEAAHRALMTLYAQTGQQTAALRQYQLCAETLASELDLAPSADTTALYNQIKLGALAAETGVGQPAASEGSARFGPRHNLPAQSTPFIGREREVAELSRLLADTKRRLLTIVGPGGVGKTRLALETAATQLDRFAHGVFFVRLAALGSATGLVPAIAEALNFRFYEGDSPPQQLNDYLREKQMLLVLDNFEQLLDAAGSPSGEGNGAETVVDLLEAAAGLKIVVTSRARLNLLEEQLYPLAGIDFLGEAEGAPGPAARQTSAVALFRHSARRVKPDFELTAEHLPAVARICRLIAGMPLGILLAAGWTEVLSPAEIAAEIERSFEFLTTDMADVPSRQQSMRAVFDHSWRLLTERERAVFRQLSVFRGGFTRHAAHAVSGATLPMLKDLLGKSFLQSGPGDRYEVHELLRQFAAEKLAQEPALAEATRDRHSAYFCAFLQERETELKGARQQAALTDIEAESENVRAAWEWAVELGPLERLEQAQQSLGRFYQWRGRYAEGHEVFQQATHKLERSLSGAEQRLFIRSMAWESIFSYELGQPDLANQLLLHASTVLDSPGLADQDTRLERALILQLMASMTGGEVGQKTRQLQKQSLTLYQTVDHDWDAAHMMVNLIFASYLAGDFDEARRFYDTSIALLRRYGDLRGMGYALLWMGNVAKHQEGQQDEAERLVREGLALMEKSGDRFGIASATYTLSIILEFGGKFAESQSLAQESLLIFNHLGHRRLHCFVNAQLGEVAMHLGHYESGRAYCQMNLHFFRETGEWFGLGVTLQTLAEIALVEDSFAEARSLLQESVSILQEHGHQTWLNLSLASLGYVERRLGNLPQARQYLAKGIRSASQLGDAFSLWNALPAVALLLADQDEPEQATELYALASRYPYVANSRWFEDIVGQHIAAIAAGLPPDVVAAAQERGRARDLWAMAEELLVELGGE